MKEPERSNCEIGHEWRDIIVYVKQLQFAAQRGSEFRKESSWWLDKMRGGEFGRRGESVRTKPKCKTTTRAEIRYGLEQQLEGRGESFDGLSSTPLTRNGLSHSVAALN